MKLLGDFYTAHTNVHYLASKFWGSVQRWETVGKVEDSHNLPIYTVLHGVRVNETLSAHTHTHTHTLSLSLSLSLWFRSIDAYLKHAHSKQKCLNTPPDPPWTHVHFITTFKTLSLFPKPTTTTTNQTRLTRTPRLFSSVHEPSCLYFSHHYFKCLI